MSAPAIIICGAAYFAGVMGTYWCQRTSLNVAIAAGVHIVTLTLCLAWVAPC